MNHVSRMGEDLPAKRQECIDRQIVVRVVSPPCATTSLVTLPGYFRPTKKWDLLVIHEKRVIAAIELKSHVGPSFGNNFNNRTEEAIGTAQDFKTAFRENAFGPHLQPFVRWLMVVEDEPKSRSPLLLLPPIRAFG